MPFYETLLTGQCSSGTYCPIFPTKRSLSLESFRSLPQSMENQSAICVDSCGHPLTMTTRATSISLPLPKQCQGTMCVPIALLNQDGVATGCEGDVNSTLAMFLLTLLSDSPVHFGEMLDVDLKANTLVTSHCGCGSPALADDDGYTLCPVRLADDGVCIRFTARPGPVTFVNLVGRKGSYRLCAFEGEAVPTGMVFEGTPLKFKMRSPFEKVWKSITDGGFGHHWMTGYGHFVPELAEFCRLTGVRGVFPDIK